MSLDFDFGFSGTFINLEFTSNYLNDGSVIYDFDFVDGDGVADGDGDSIFPILLGLSNHHVAIWCDSTASLTNGRFYVSTEDSLTIINNKNGQAILEDFYSKSIAGASQETLKSEDIVDLVVAY